MKRRTVLLLLGLALTGAGRVQAATRLPWSTVADLKNSVAAAYRAAACGDSRPIEVSVIEDGLDTYHFVVNADARWAIIGPIGSQGETPVWYGTVREGRLAIERAIVGTPETDVCPLLTRQEI